MGDNIDDVIQGILDRARQRKDLLSKMVSKSSDSRLQDQMEGEVEKSSVKVCEDKEIVTIINPLKEKQLTANTPNKVTESHDLSPGRPKLRSTPVTPKPENKVSSVAAKFSSLSEALNSKQTTNVNIIHGGVTRVQKVTLNVANKENVSSPPETEKPSAARRLGIDRSSGKEDEEDNYNDLGSNVLRHQSPTRKRGRLALANLASMYSEMDEDAFGCAKESHGDAPADPAVESGENDATAATLRQSPSKPEERSTFGLARLVSKDSELVRRYANGGGDEDWNFKPPAVRNCNAPAATTKATKRWTTPAPQTTTSTFVPPVSLLTSKPAPVSQTGTSGSLQTRPVSVVHSKISVAETAKLFESSAASPAVTSPAAPTSSIAKARAAFFNSLAVGSTPAPKTISTSVTSAVVNARAVFTRPASASRTAASGIESSVSMATSPSPATYTTSVKLGLAVTPSTPPVTSAAAVVEVPLVALKEEEEEESSPTNIVKTSRRDSWEDSKVSEEVEKEEDFVEQKKLGRDLEEAMTREEGDDDNDVDEEEENKVFINDEDFGNTSQEDSACDDANDVVDVCDDDDDEDDDDESEDEFILSKPLLNEEISITKDVSNVASPIKNAGNSEATTPNEVEERNEAMSPNEDGEDVTRRKTTKRRSGSFQKPRGYISLHEYRQIQRSRPKSQPPPAKPKRARNDENVSSPQQQQQISNNSATSPCNGVIMRNKKLYPDLSSDITTSSSYHRSGGHKTVQQRIVELNDSINKELNVIHQTSNALNKCCHELSSFAGSPEAVECHKLLLMACKRREAYVIEMQKLKAANDPQAPYLLPGSDGPMGRLAISEIRLPMKAEFMAKLGTSEDMTAHYFLLAVRHNNVLLFSQMTSTHEGQLSNKHRRRDYLEFPNLISLNNIGQDFRVEVEIFGMSITRIQDQGTPRKTQRKALLTPRSSRRYESPAGPTSVRTTNFVHLASVHLDKDRVASEMFTLDKVPRSCPLQSCMFMNVKCLMENVVCKKDFLTMFEDVSGFGAWHRRWFSLRNGLLSYWKYPDDELNKEPIGVVDLKTCVTANVGLVSRDVCAHPNTFEVETTRKQRRGDRNTLVQTCDERANCTTVRYWLAADTAEDRKSWCNSLNETLMNLRAWHPDAARPTSKR